MKNKWIHFTNHAIQRLRERHISKKVVLKAFRRLAEIPAEKYLLLITPATIRKWFGNHTALNESLFVVAHYRCVITCYFCKDEMRALQYSRYKGKKIIVVNLQNVP